MNCRWKKGKKQGDFVAAIPSTYDVDPWSWNPRVVAINKCLRGKLSSRSFDSYWLHTMSCNHKEVGKGPCLLLFTLCLIENLILRTTREDSRNKAMFFSAFNLKLNFFLIDGKKNNVAFSKTRKVSKNHMPFADGHTKCVYITIPTSFIFFRSTRLQPWSPPTLMTSSPIHVWRHHLIKTIRRTMQTHPCYSNQQMQHQNPCSSMNYDIFE